MVFGLGALLFFAVATPALACGPGENMTHFGVVSVIDHDAMTLTLTDAQTGNPITFAASHEQLSGIKVNDQVSVHYSESEYGLVADEISS